MTDSNIKILLIGEYSIFRNALRMLIETRKKLKVVGETADFAQASEIITKSNPHLLLVDLPDTDERDTFAFLQEAVVHVPVLVLAGRHDVVLYQKCLRLGISGLVLKEKSAETLFKAIEKVCEGELWFDRSVMGQTIRQLINEKNAPAKATDAGVIETLTEREKQVVDLICKGMKNKGIAEKLFITETTVRHHLTSIFNKLDITSRLELVIYAFRHNIVKIQSPNPNGFYADKTEPATALLKGLNGNLKGASFFGSEG